MNFEPQKFFVGLIDFFSILLPGAVLAYLLKDAAGPWILGPGYQSLRGAEAWVILLVASYVLGHFLFLMGSWLDHWPYEPLRRRTDKGQIWRLYRGGKPSPQLIRWLAWVCFKKGGDAAQDRVIRIQERYLKRIEAAGAVNAFQWCKSRLAIEHPEVLATVNRFEADSKFFRSFVPVLFALVGAALFCRQEWLAFTWLVLLALALWRYMDQRFKSTQQAYWAIITLEACKDSPQADADRPGKAVSEELSSAPTHAGGVVYRRESDKTEYLLVQAKDDANQWVLPKGHVEPGEDPRYTAIREVNEETGVWARVVGDRDLGVSEYSYKGKAIRVRFFLMEALAKGKPEESLRRSTWLILADALKKATHSQSQDLLRLAGDPTNRVLSAVTGGNKM